MTLQAEYIAAACEGKHGYASLQKAHRIAKKKRGLEHYHCPHCGLWHIGKPPR